MKTTKDLGVLIALLGVAMTGCPDDGNDDSTMPTGDSAGGTAGNDGSGDGSDGGDTPGDDGGDAPDDGGDAPDDGGDAPDDGGDTSSDGGDTSSDGGSDDGTTADDGSTGSTGSPLLDACDDFYATYDACFPRYAGYGDCDYLDHAFPADEPCADAIADYMVCLSAVDCDTLESYAGFPCHDEFEASHGVCPDALGACQIGRGTGELEGTVCDSDLDNCLDGHAYHVECQLDGAGTSVDCTCTIDDAASGSFSLMTGEALCAGQDVVTALSASCDWPEDVATDLL